MTPDTYDFTGNATTIAGFFGILATSVVIVIAYRRYWNSPYRQ